MADRISDSEMFTQKQLPEKGAEDGGDVGRARELLKRMLRRVG